MKRTLFFVAFVLIGSFSAMALVDAERPAEDRRLALVGATVYVSPTLPPIPNGVVVIRDGKIVAVGPKEKVEIPAGTSVLRCDGMFVTAGFQNSHVHFTESKWEDAAGLPAAQLSAQLGEMLLRYGFTTIVDTGSQLANTVSLRARIESGEVRGPRILTAGSPLYPEDGIPYYLKNSLPPNVLASLATPKTPEESAAVAKERIAGGADIVKLFTGSWVGRSKVLPMRTEVASSATAEAHRRGKLVFSHASNVEGLEVALQARVDVLAHALEDVRGWNDSYLARMKAGHMAMVPTLKLFGGQPYTKYIQQEVGDYARAGGPILFGTDVGYLTDYDAAEEYALMAGAGLDWRQILASLTTAPAERFGEAKRRGRIAVGMDADMVVLAADPAVDVKAFSNVHLTLRGGRILYRSP